MAVSATIGLIGFAIGGQIELARFAATLFFIPDLTLRDPFVLNRPIWSIFSELAINLAHAAILWRCRTPVIILCTMVSAVILPFNPGKLIGGFVVAGIAALVTRYLDPRIPFDRLVKPANRQPASA